MMSKTQIDRTDFREKELVDRIKKGLKKNYKTTMKSSDIKKMWELYCDLYIHQPVVNSLPVKIRDFIGIIEVVKMDRKETNAGLASLSGFSLMQGGLRKPFEQKNLNRLNYVYKFVYQRGSMMNEKTKFKASPDLRKKLTQSLNNTNRDYRFVTKCQLTNSSL